MQRPFTEMNFQNKNIGYNPKLQRNLKLTTANSYQTRQTRCKLFFCIKHLILTHSLSRILLYGNNNPCHRIHHHGISQLLKIIYSQTPLSDSKTAKTKYPICTNQPLYFLKQPIELSSSHSIQQQHFSLGLSLLHSFPGVAVYFSILCSTTSAFIFSLANNLVFLSFHIQ